ncbi:hypothetical protein DYY67_2178 [Candidatus Nitrosotalea sp. TS]|uniref:hypothetical protein n=1 Tax=Candidatus Nitrosotalea sp. TS TaxID=2341020 RepID=UPI001ECE30C5|nr:hypothetical protein [Candidatus Nitrosotalea sp. TS]NHI04001.1 hypothetical protein [Candidatus Nitrosotalea sp. TS]
MGAAIGISYYQQYYIPEFNAKPIIPEKVLQPGSTTNIVIVPELKTLNSNRTLYQIKLRLNLV